ncbi:hypothetical protein N9P66_04080 [Salibacteraceae bacterium]|jgi:hypothetical protein|nr:hypothetical protein [Salibacteraceae bacterium]
MKKKAFDSQANNLIPRFIGTKEDFNKYLSGYCRNLVQKITKAYKLQIGQCEKCEEKNKQLDAAHVHGKERREIINSILKDFTMRDSMEINLNVFEERFIEAHRPIKSVIKILCKECHREYDNDIAHKPVNRERVINSIIKNNSHYDSSRLLFKRDVIEALGQKESFSIHVRHTNETFRMTKEEFYKSFDNVSSSNSYQVGGSYSYTDIPKRTYKFLVGAKSNLNQEFYSEERSTQVTASVKIKIGREVQSFFKEYGKSLTAEIIKKLLSKEYSKNQLGCNFPVLLERGKSPFCNGLRRYYVGEFVPGYWLCSQWYERDREGFKRFKHKWLADNK